ncbi:MAG: ABC transporter permease [Acidimicrobiales bacterium]
MSESIGFWDAIASFSLVAVVVAISGWRRLHLERAILWAAARATLQLLAVGVLFSAIFSSDLANVWAWIWVGGMVVMSAVIVERRAPEVPGLIWMGLLAIVLTTAIVLSVVFLLRILDPEPVAIVVISGITLGNTMPSVVLGADRMMETLREQRGQLEALLALGCDREQSTVHAITTVLRSALIPQIERTKVVGLIALPGAMTGLLLAGTDPIDAIIIQLMVMFLVLGAVATSVVVVARAIASKALTEDLRLADWTQPGSGPAG